MHIDDGDDDVDDDDDDIRIANNISAASTEILQTNEKMRTLDLCKKRETEENHTNTHTNI